MDFIKTALEGHSGSGSHSSSHESGSQQQQHQQPSSTGDKLFGKIAGALGGGHHSSSNNSPHDQSHSSGQSHGSSHGAGGLMGSLGGMLGGHHQEPPKPQTFGDKISNVFGGGASGEKKEDGLDKAIDFVQEHVLKKGPQGNESAMEQAKDKVIAETIRNNFQKVTGKDFPSFGHGSK